MHATSLGIVGLVGLSVVRVDLGLVVLSGGLGGVLIVVLVLLVVVSLALAETDVCAARAGRDGDICQRALAFNAASLAGLRVLDQLRQMFAVELDRAALGADSELQVGLKAEIPLKLVQTRACGIF